jgi:hypothetical protein
MDLLIALALARGFENAEASAGSGRHRFHPVAQRRRTFSLRSVRRRRTTLGDPAPVTP